jgi:hypothetical protein
VRRAFSKITTQTGKNAGQTNLGLLELQSKSSLDSKSTLASEKTEKRRKT